MNGHFYDRLVERIVKKIDFTLNVGVNLFHYFVCILSY